MDTTSINPETANYLDGPGLYAWLEEVDGLERLSERIGDQARTLTGWREGRAAGFYTADEILIRLGRHISEVPHHLYRPDPEKNEKSPEIREEIIRRVHDLGEKPGAVARALGICPKTVFRHAGLQNAA